MTVMCVVELLKTANMKRRLIPGGQERHGGNAFKGCKAFSRCVATIKPGLWLFMSICTESKILEVQITQILCKLTCVHSPKSPNHEIYKAGLIKLLARQVIKTIILFKNLFSYVSHTSIVIFYDKDSLYNKKRATSH